ncbi:MAG: plasmid pRiA4b ORF-3 family protein [Planctomycetaceae bacterium]|nr:plasmid pRiA4b ORF-3 family protein [Planctomycetaceae bacterium]
MPRKKTTAAAETHQPISDDAAKKAKLLAENAVQLATFGAQALVTAESLRIKTKPLDHFTLSPAQRDILLDVPDISKVIKNKLAKGNSSFTVAEVASMTMALAEVLTEGDPRKQIAVLNVAKHLVDRLQAGIAGLGEIELSKAKEPKAKADPSTVYQFKITLIDSKPPIWRRIQVADCTLDKLHEHIQTAMGWTNSHLHQFEIFEKRYGNPELLDDGFDGFTSVDSTKTKLSQIVPNAGKRFRFTYEYDFGDGWAHEILFEGTPKKELGTKSPLCLEGERACPPEDVGGMGGFYDFLEALADPEHERHDEFMEWGGGFDPKEFDAKQATKAMTKGLPDWR